MVQVAMRTFALTQMCQRPLANTCRQAKAARCLFCQIALDVQLAPMPAFPCMVQVARRTYTLPQLRQRPPWLTPVMQTKAALPVCQIALNVPMAQLACFSELPATWDGGKACAFHILELGSPTLAHWGCLPRRRQARGTNDSLGLSN
jgi:hypothetical protein